MKNKKMIIKAVVLCVMVAGLSGCMKYGADGMNYADAKEMPPLKLPPDSLALSKRYDIPDIPGNKDLIITNNQPPDYY